MIHLLFFSAIYQVVHVLSIISSWVLRLVLLPGPADADVVSWHHAGELGRAAFGHLDVIGSCGDPQVSWTKINFNQVKKNKIVISYQN